MILLTCFCSATVTMQCLTTIMNLDLHRKSIEVLPMISGLCNYVVMIQQLGLTGKSLTSLQKADWSLSSTSFWRQAALEEEIMLLVQLNVSGWNQRTTSQNTNWTTNKPEWQKSKSGRNIIGCDFIYNSLMIFEGQQTSLAVYLVIDLGLMLLNQKNCLFGFVHRGLNQPVRLFLPSEQLKAQRNSNLLTQWENDHC